MNRCVELCLKQQKKELSTKTHEERLRATKRDGSASTVRTATKRIINIDAQDAQDFFRIRLAWYPGHRQARTGSSPQPASGAGTSRPVNPVNPVHPCLITYRFPGAVAVRSKWRRWPSPAGLWCGRDARAPGWASSHDRITPRGQNCRSVPGPLAIVRKSIRICVYSCPFVVRLY